MTVLSKIVVQLTSREVVGLTCFFQMDPVFEPQELETRTIFGLQLEQLRNNAKIDESVFRNIVTKRQDVSPREISKK